MTPRKEGSPTRRSKTIIADTVNARRNEKTKKLEKERQDLEAVAKRLRLKQIVREIHEGVFHGTGSVGESVWPDEKDINFRFYKNKGILMHFSPIHYFLLNLDWVSGNQTQLFWTFDPRDASKNSPARRFSEGTGRMIVTKETTPDAIRKVLAEWFANRYNDPGED